LCPHPGCWTTETPWFEKRSSWHAIGWFEHPERQKRQIDIEEHYVEAVQRAVWPRGRFSKLQMMLEYRLFGNGQKNPYPTLDISDIAMPRSLSSQSFWIANGCTNVKS
jgi:hypothetical protein